MTTGLENPSGSGTSALTLAAVIAPTPGTVVSRRMSSLRANEAETQTCREFTLEGRGRSIEWLCPF